jgi:hypothetical protein
MSRTVNHAFEAFVRVARSVGAVVVIEPLTRDSYRVARVSRNGGEFRLTVVTISGLVLTLGKIFKWF